MLRWMAESDALLGDRTHFAWWLELLYSRSKHIPVHQLMIQMRLTSHSGELRDIWHDSKYSNGESTVAVL